MKKKYIATVLSAALIAGALAGCGGGAGNAPTMPAETTSTEESAAEAASPEKSAAETVSPEKSAAETASESSVSVTESQNAEAEPLSESAVADAYAGDSTASAGLTAGEIFKSLNGMEFGFASGAGGWSSDLTFRENGTFTGSYADSDMGSTGDGYPGGTLYICEFSGKFEVANIINDNSVTLRLTELAMKNQPGEEWIEDNILYVASEPYGIAGSEEFILYFPGTPTSELTEDALSWYRMPRALSENEMPATLPCYGLYNVTEGNTFYSYG